MEYVTIAKLKNRLSAYLRKVRAGETIIVCDRKTPIAQLTPVQVTESQDDRIARLIAEGKLIPPKNPWPPGKLAELLRQDPPDVGTRLLDALLDEREEGR